MDPKNRWMIVLAVTFLIVGALFTSFGRSFVALNTPPVSLPSSAPEVPPPSGSEPYQRVEITPQTVQEVIATLARPESYYREISVETLWETGSTVTQAQVWTDGGWSHSRRVLPSGVIRHDLVGEDILYYWYDGSREYLSAPADSLSADLAQRIPTYETVLELDSGHIAAAGYEAREGLACIYVEVSPSPDTLERYWVSVESGLLVSAELEREGALAYRMTAYGAVTSPCPPNASFTLPDGTALHAIS